MPAPSNKSKVNGEKSGIWAPMKKQEQDFLRPRMARIDQLERAQALAERVMTLRNQPGYQEFLKVIEDLHEAALNELVGTTADTASLQVLQGKVQAFRNILSVMKNTENARDTLAVQLKAAQDEVEHMVGPEGRATPSKDIWR
jgi:bacterioferritin (cytochrome b1)